MQCLKMRVFNTDVIAAKIIETKKWFDYDLTKYLISVFERKLKIVLKIF